MVFYLEKNNLMSRLCGFIISFLLCIVVVCTTWNSGLVYERRIQLSAISVVIVWLIFLIVAKGWNEYKSIKIILSVAFFVYLALFMGHIWHRGYITNTLLIGINAESEGLFRDTLYYNAIASSIEYYGYPSVLVNSADFHNYHFGSHLILGLISRLLGMPSIFSYCYIYPILFFQMYAGLILSTGRGLRKLLKKTEKIGLADIIVLLSFVSYFLLPQIWSDGIGNKKTSWLVSESFCVAITLGLLFFNLTLLVKDYISENKVIGIIWEIVITPLFIIIISLSQISVGLIFTFAIVYLLFRINGMKPGYLVLEMAYVIILFAVHYIPSKIYSLILSGSAEGIYSISFLDYLKTYVKDPSLWGMHVIAFFALPCE